MAHRLVRLVFTNNDYAKKAKSLPKQRGVEIVALDNWKGLAKASKKGSFDTVIISRMRDIGRLPHHAEGHSNAKHLVFLESFPVEAIADRLSQLNVRNPSRLHIAQGDDASGLLTRMIGPTRQRHRILDSWVEDGELVLIAPAFERLRVPLAKLSPFLGSNEKQIREFEIDRDGSFLFWPHANAHMGWAQLQDLVDPTLRIKADQERGAFNKQYGNAIRAFREECKLPQTSVMGIADRTLRRVERGEAAASRATLAALAEAHQLELRDYMKQLALRMKSPS